MSARQKPASTNEKQSEKLAYILQDYMSIPKGFVKLETTLFWKDLADDLNSLGPPIRAASEWKKIWIAIKSDLDKQLTECKQEQQAPACSPTKMRKLSPLEELLVALNREKAPETVGAQSASAPSVADPRSATAAVGDPQKPTRRKRQSTTQNAICSEQQQQQVQLQDQLRNYVVNVLRANTKTLEDLANRNQEVVKRMSDMACIMDKQLKEQLRHNAAMEKLTLEKMKSKETILQLEVKRLRYFATKREV